MIGDNMHNNSFYPKYISECQHKALEILVIYIDLAFFSFLFW